MPGGCRAVEGETVPEIVYFNAGGEHRFDTGGKILKVMTLNLAHGRGTRALQEFVSDKKTRENLDEVAELLVRERPVVAAFQEADIKSRRSGNFNHVNYIAERAGYLQAVHGEHTKGLGFYHGTALISALQMSEPLSVAFEPKLPSPDKGFVVCTVEFGERKVDIVSVHLDVASDKVRQEQVEVIVNILSKRGNGLVVMGDFNCELQNSRQLYQILNEGLSLSAYEFDSKELDTFGLVDRRIDWILISNELEFYSYFVLEDKVSDHLAVVAELMPARDNK
ncbi:MAG: endonuclease/exonuclease/phosphatase family protein [Planctomycetota bacterium]|jgi:endonuclease/exonuclease/phosphatase family metal-dependent hydrolase